MSVAPFSYFCYHLSYYRAYCTYLTTADNSIVLPRLTIVVQIAFLSFPDCFIPSQIYPSTVACYLVPAYFNFFHQIVCFNIWVFYFMC